MGVLDGQMDEGIGVGLSNVAGPVDHTGFFSNVGAGYRETLAGGHSTHNAQNAREAKYYDQMISALTAEGEMGSDKLDVRPGGIGYRGPKNLPVNAYGVGQVDIPRNFRNPYTDAPSLSQNDNPLNRFYLGGDTAESSAIWDAVKRVRARKPGFLKDLPDPASLSAKAIADRQRDLIAAQAVTDRASTAGKVGGFIGNLAGAFASGDPENFIGGGSGAAGKTIARTIIKRGIEEGAANAVAGAVALPGQVADTHRLGQEMSPGDMAKSVVEQGALGFLMGGAHAAVPHVGAKVGEAVGAVAGKVSAIPALRDPLVAASIRAGTVKDHTMLAEWRRTHSPYSISDTATPDEKAAAHVIERDVATKEASPLHPEADGHNDRRLEAVARSLGLDLPPPRLPSTVPIQLATVPDRSAGATSPRRAATLPEALHHAEGTSKNPDSTADGHFQFIEKTWLAYAPRVADTKGMSRSQVLGLRHDLGIATKAERLFRADNARYLRDHGVEDSPGNLSMAHFLGNADAAKVARADPSTPISQIVHHESIAANPNVFKKIATAEDMIAWAHKRIGVAVDAPPARGDAVAEYDPIEDGIPPENVTYATFAPHELQTDAGLMQYKSGGDEQGVTDALKGVTAWNPIMSQQILVYERADGSRIVADGHQRTALAKRLDDPTIQLPALVIREADGVTPEHARTLAALRNIANGTGTLLDNAKVLRDAPSGARQLAPNGPAAQDILGLSRLSHEAFGAAINGVIDPAVAAKIGTFAPPDTHGAMVEMLHMAKVRNPKEAAHVVRQAVADGFGTAEGEQLGMFGDMPQQSLYVPIARILEAASKRLRDEKRTFGVLASKAGRIEGAGNVLDRTANADRVVSSAEALAILHATAHSSGPVRDALIAAARAELSGSGRSAAVSQFLDQLGTIDLRAAAGGLEPHGGHGSVDEQSGQEVTASSADENVSGFDGPSLFEQAVSAKTLAEPFSDPHGQAAKDQVALLDHDLRMDAEAAKPDAITVQREALKTARQIVAAVGMPPEFVEDVFLVGSRAGGTSHVGSDHDFVVRFKGDPNDPKVMAAWDALSAHFDKVTEAPVAGGSGKTDFFVTDELYPNKPAIGSGAADPNIDARQSQETALKAASPLQSVAEQQGTMGLGLFDVADQPTFRLSEEGDAQPLHEILAEADADETAATNAKACLQ